MDPKVEPGPGDGQTQVQQALRAWHEVNDDPASYLDNWLLAPGAADETILDSDEPPEGWAAEPATPKSLTTN